MSECADVFFPFVVGRKAPISKRQGCSRATTAFLGRTPWRSPSPVTPQGGVATLASS